MSAGRKIAGQPRAANFKNWANQWAWKEDGALHALLSPRSGRYGSHTSALVLDVSRVARSNKFFSRIHMRDEKSKHVQFIALGKYLILKWWAHKGSNLGPAD
jgi:hypothetical protein